MHYTDARARAWTNLQSYMLSLDNGNGPRMRVILYGKVARMRDVGQADGEAIAIDKNY